MKQNKTLTTYEKTRFCVLVPVYYENETRPAWRKYAITDTAESARKAYESAPDYLNATEDENRKNRQWKRAEMLFLYEIGKRNEADVIREQYRF